MLQLPFPSWSHLEIGRYFHELFAFDSSLFAVQVLPEEWCFLVSDTGGKVAGSQGVLTPR